MRLLRRADSCAECQSEDGGPTYYSLSESDLLRKALPFFLVGKLHLMLQEVEV